MTAGLALQNVFIQLFILWLLLKPRDGHAYRPVENRCQALFSKDNVLDTDDRPLYFSRNVIDPHSLPSTQRGTGIAAIRTGSTNLMLRVTLSEVREDLLQSFL